MHCYQLSPHVCMELFDEDAVLLVADRDVMVTVNHAAAQLFKMGRETVGDGLFSRSDCVTFLLNHFELTKLDAEKKMRSMLSFGLKQCLVLKRAVV